MHLQKPGKIVRKKYLGCLIIVAVFFLLPQVFASGNSTQSSNDILLKLLDALYLILDLSSRLWIVLGNFAGKMMTNTFVYGEFMNLDTYLWQIWQIVRMFSNFVIGFLFFYYILSNIFTSYVGKQANTIKKNIINLLLASVLVQMSWFLVMLIVDISTILMTTVSTIPSQLIAADYGLQGKLETQLNKNTVFNAGLNNSIIRLERSSHNSDRRSMNIIPTVTTEGAGLTKEQILDNILPHPNSLSGPLMYLGFVILEAQNINVFYAEKLGTNDFDVLMKELLSIVVNAGVIILYTISLALLLLINIVRVITIWIFIVTSPILVLVGVLPGGKKLIKNKNLGELLNIQTMLNMIFKPVLFALFLSLAMVVLILFRDLTSKNHLKFAQTDLTSQQITSDQPDAKTSTLEIKNMFHMVVHQGQKTIGDMLLSIISLMLIWFLIKLAITKKTGVKFLDNVTESATKLVDSTIGSIPMIPTPAGTIGFGGVEYLTDSYKRNNPIQKYVEKRTMEDNKKVRGMMGLDKEINRVRSNKTKTHINSLTKHQNGNINGFGAFTASLQKDYNGFYFQDIATPLMEWINQGTWGSDALTSIGINGPLKDALKAKTDPKEFYDHLLSNLASNKKEFFENVLKLSGDTNHLTSYEQLKNMKVDKEGKFRTS